MKDEKKTKKQLVEEIIELRKQISDMQTCASEQKLHETQYKAITQASIDGFWLVDLQGNFIDVNEAYCRLTGYSRDELLTMKTQDIEAAESYEETARHLTKVKEIGHDRFETRHRCKNGNIVDIEVSTNYLEIEDGKLFVSLRDITERKKIEEALLKTQQKLEDTVKERTAELSKANEDLLAEIAERKQMEEALKKKHDFLKNILNTAQAIILILDANGYIVSFNPYMEEISGYRLDEVMRKEWFATFLPKEDRDRIRTLFKTAIGNIKTKGNINPILTKDGREIYIEWYDTTLKGDDGKIIGLLAIGQDVTERKKAEETIRRNEEHFRLVIENALVIINILETDGTIRYVSPSIERLLGYKREERIGRNAFELIHQDDLPKVKSIFEQLLQNPDTPFTIEFRYMHKDGSWRYFEAIGINLLKNPAVSGIIINSNDITERKQAEKALQNAHDELEMRVQERTSALEKVNKALETEINIREQTEKALRTYQTQLRSMAAELSLIEEKERRSIAIDIHDHIGQTLAFANMKLEALKESLSSAELAEKMDEVSVLIKQSLQYIRSLSFDLSSPILYELGFEAAVEWLTDHFQENHNMQIDFQDDKKLRPINDEVRVLLYKAVRELLVNIVKHAQAKTAKVSIRRNLGNMEIMVEDNGIGFDPSRIELYTSGHKGFGFISISERLKYLGGSFEIRSTPGQGTRVILTVPLRH